MKEFKLNEYIKLKLEDKTTNIYVKNVLFNQCKSLLFITTDKIRNLDEIRSIDEATENSPVLTQIRYREPKYYESEFWGYCSNLQVWIENDYDTRLLHRTIAFPLLKKLTDVGDPKARKVFKEEIIKRFAIGYEPVRKFLRFERYLNYLEKEELKSLNIKPFLDEFRVNKYIILKLEKGISNIYIDGVLFNQCKSLLFNTNPYKVNFGDIDSIDQVAQELGWTEKEGQERMGYYIQDVSADDEFWGYSSSLQAWAEDNYNPRLIHSTLAFPMLISLTKAGDRIARKALTEDVKKRFSRINNSGVIHLLNEGILEHINIEEIKKISFTRIYEDSLSIPESIYTLTSLQNLFLMDNKLTTLSKSICKLTSLKKLNLSWNKLENLPESIGNLSSLETLNLACNKLVSLPESMSNLTSLRNLDLTGNRLMSLPDLTSITSLEELNLINNFKLDLKARSMIRQMKRDGVNVSSNIKMEAN